LEDWKKQFRKYEIRIRKAISSHLQGDFHSVFKGSGLEYDDVRAYQYGDDVRHIDWNVSAKGHGTFIKTYREEKEQSVFFLVDVSRSQDIGRKGNQKIDLAKTLTGVLALAAIKESSQVGLIAFSDRKELYIGPKKGEKHVYFLLNKLIKLQPESVRTSVKSGIIYSLNHIRKKSVVILISDFVDEGFEHELKGLARKHDLIIIQTTDPRESSLPRLGIIPVKEIESGKTRWLNTNGKQFNRLLRDRFTGNQDRLEQFCRLHEINYLQVDTSEDFVPKLIKLFKVRNKSMKRVS